MRSLARGLCGLAAILANTGWAQVTQRVSLDSAGTQGNDPSFYPSISADGRFVAFSSFASNLVPGDTNGAFGIDVFVRDRVTGATERVSVSSSGVEGDAQSFEVSVSADARFVAFGSLATNLVPGDTNGVNDIFVHDRRNRTTERVSLSSGGAEGNDYAASPSISADGRYVAFVSFASNLAPQDANGIPDVFVHDRQSGMTRLVSKIGILQQPLADWDLDVAISADGRFVAFSTYANDQVPGDIDGDPDVFVRDLSTGVLECVSVNANGVQGNRWSLFPSLSADGRYVAFASGATNLVPGDTNACADVFVRDRLAGTIERVSVDPGGSQGNGASSESSLSADGRYVAFTSEATSLVAGDTNGCGDVFLRDRQSGTTERVSLDSAGKEASFGSASPSISADGRHVAFDCPAADLVPADTNNVYDVFLRDRAHGGYASVCEPGVSGVVGCPCANPPSGPDRGCDNSSATGGADLAASGGATLSSDSLVFTTSGERPAALSIVSQADGVNSAGAIFGMGVLCASGSMKRLYTKAAVGGSITAPDFDAGDVQVSVRSASLGDTILAGGTRWYQVFYRDPMVLGGCPADSTFNTTPSKPATWSP